MLSDLSALVFLHSGVKTFPLNFCSEMTDIMFHGRKRENYNNPTLESRFKAAFNLHVHSEILGWGGRRNLDREGERMVLLFNNDAF